MPKKIYFVIILFLLFIAFADTSSSIQLENDTELYVIGTVHESTDSFNSDTLLNILNKIKPDLILIESDSSYFTPDFRLNDDVKYEFLETSAVSEYLKNNTSLLRPYDISGRDKFLDDKKRLSDESDFFNDVSVLKEKGRLSREADQIYDKIFSMMNTAGNLSYSAASFINSTEGSSKIDTINYYTYDGLGLLISLTPELEKYRAYWDKECSYNEKRNRTMLRNILKIADLYEGKRIVVLCGFAHKNILINGINKSKNKKIVLKDFWINY